MGIVFGVRRVNPCGISVKIVKNRAIGKVCQRQASTDARCQRCQWVTE